MKSCKIVVAHPYQQHSFRTASAVKKMGCLYAYVRSEERRVGKEC